jgi:hypothetical protein
MADEWYYTQQGQQRGPVSTAELKQLAVTNQLLPTDLIWREGLPKWVPAGSTKELFPEPPPTAVASASVAPPPVAETAEAADAGPRPGARRRRLEDEEADYDYEERLRRRRQAPNTGLIIGLVAGGVGLLVVAVVIIILVIVLSGGATHLTLTNGQVTENGQLTSNDAFDRVRLRCYCKAYSINLTRGRIYQIDMVSGALDSYLRLENAVGQQLAQDDDSGGFLNARIVFRCPQSGNYRIICTTFGPSQTGPYTLTVRER